MVNSSLRHKNTTTPPQEFKRLKLEGEIVFRLAREDDLSKLEWMGAYTSFRRVFSYTYREQQKGLRLMLLAVYNHYPIGQIFIHIKESEFLFGEAEKRGYLYSLRVMPPFQRRGLGRELILQAEGLMMARGIESAGIAVNKDNPAALELYEKLGYEIYAEDEGEWSYTDHRGQYIQMREPCYLLQKQLVEK